MKKYSRCLNDRDRYANETETKDAYTEMFVYANYGHSDTQWTAQHVCWRNRVKHTSKFAECIEIFGNLSAQQNR